MKIYFVTCSDPKFSEVSVYLDRLKSRGEASVELQQVRHPLQETLDLDINLVVRNKTIEAYEYLRRPCVVEHSGLFISALSKLPGVLGKMIWNSVESRMCSFLNPEDPRDALAVSVLGYCDGKQIRLYRGETPGQVAEAARGERGFNWDAIFIPEGSHQTYGEMMPQDKWATAPSLKAWGDFLRKEFSAGPR